MSVHLETYGKATCVSPKAESQAEATRELVARVGSLELGGYSWRNEASMEGIAGQAHVAMVSTAVCTTSETHETQRQMRNADLVRLFGLANEFKEGDEAIGLAAKDDTERQAARLQLAALPLKRVTARAFLDSDDVSETLEASVDHAIASRMADWTLGDLQKFLLESNSAEIHEIMPGLRSEVIAGVSKLLSNDELCAVASKVYNQPTVGGLGAEGVFSSRIQPNSATDDPTEVLFSVLEGLSYGCGDAIFGINIVASDPGNVGTLERTLREVVDTFGLRDTTRWCVLAHIDDQVLVEGQERGLVDCGFQSIGGNQLVQGVFNLSVAKLEQQLRHVSGRAQYFETGQGSAVTNRADGGVDMVTLEARAHGLARAMAQRNGYWTIVNTVAGFIGPEVFRSKEQLLRACLEDVFMGKLHGLVFGLDICSTYHMSLEIHEMFEIQDAVMRAGPGFYMAVAGNSDPMLSYLTTSFRDHPRLRATHKRRVTRPLEAFLQRLGIMDDKGAMTERAGDTEWVYVCFRRAKGDGRSEAELRAEARATLTELQSRGLDLGYGHDGQFRAPPALRARHEAIYNDAKRVIFRSLSPAFVAGLGCDTLAVYTCAKDRLAFCRSPTLGEALDAHAAAALERFWARQTAPGGPWVFNPGYPRVRLQVLVSDGLNAQSVEAPGHFAPFYERLLALASSEGNFGVANAPVAIVNGRVRAGYAVGHALFGSRDDLVEYDHGVLVYCIGERPGNGKCTFSAYIACASRELWQTGKMDHNLVDVVSGISLQALSPGRAADNVFFFIRRRLGSLGVVA